MANLHLITGYAGAAHITAADNGSFNAALFGTGNFVLDRGNKFSATVVTNNSIRIADGDLLLQGRHIRLEEGIYVDLAIDNGAQGYNRNDLIVARYTKNSSTGIEECNLIVIKGTATTGVASDPAYTSGDIISDHVTIADFPLYRVPLNGLTVGTLVKLFTVTDNFGAHISNTNNPHKVTAAQIGAAPSGHTHDDRYYTESEVNTLLAAKAASNHTHDDRYYTESEIDSKLSGKANSSHTHNYLPLAGGTLTGALKLTSGVHYGTSLPSAGQAGRIFFKKV